MNYTNSTSSQQANSTSLVCPPDDVDVQWAYFAGAISCGICLITLLPFIFTFYLGRPFRLLVSRKRTAEVYWLLIMVAVAVAGRTILLAITGATFPKTPTAIECESGLWREETCGNPSYCGFLVTTRLFEVVISMLSFVGTSGLLPHMGYAAHARALAGGTAKINFAKLDALPVLDFGRLSHLVLDRWLLLIQATMVVSAIVMDFTDIAHPSPSAGWTTIPIYKALGLQYSVVQSLNGVLFVVVGLEQREFFRVVLRRLCCPRPMALKFDDDSDVMLGELASDNFSHFGRSERETGAEEPSMSEGVDAFLDYRREEAKKRVAGSYAYFGFMAIIVGSMFLVRGVLQGYIEISNKKLQRFMVEPIFTDVLPDIVPVACILEVLVPSGVLSYTRACLRPLFLCLESRNSRPVVAVIPGPPITPTANSSYE